MADEIITEAMPNLADTIRHSGVKGMKWGVVRSRGANGQVRGSASEDHVTSRILKKTKPSQMSNAELRKLNERLQLERTNNDLQSRSAMAKIKTGTQVAGTILAVGTTINSAYKFTKSPAGRALIDGVKKSLGS